MKKPRLRKAGLLAQGHITRGWGSKNLNLCLSDSKAAVGVLKHSDGLPLREVAKMESMGGLHHTLQF